MELLLNLLVILFFIGGGFFFFVGTLGLIRMPDVFCRMHATTKCDTLGAGLILIGLMIYKGFDIIFLKLLIIIIFIWITNPTAAHIIAKAQHNKMKSEALKE
ncbi:monovalent cation/H(+) antiporter subunit G [Alkaliphilus pronyensis]|uniref:Monovalent cation/H(+) antiporter subunit G n=1 Tax=Alkaliphilus pronyensis TaxID=1482732 RepID=A0A6I0EXZ9_9FIRM|nr:monovalent cation/H(+) antiporter subunit G [Alkaliphilus pronyensis]KAB3534151.1 monovalent cation/H(+) antiporter subunit G [Alkaliphilus pronyensis]